MRIVHISDTHLGFAAYRALDKTLRVNQREADINQAFSQAIDKIIALRPDVVLHTGDFFDTVRPSNRALSFGIEQLLRLSQANIPTVLIAGNHSSPKMHDTGSAFQLFTLFDNLYPVYHGKYQKFNFGKLSPTRMGGTRGRNPAPSASGGLVRGLTVHAIPQCPGKEDFEKSFEQISLEQGYNVLMLHAGLSGIKEFSMGEFNEQIIPESYLKDDFDYCALGHFHKFTQVKANAYYAGSIERLSFSESNQEKGFVEINLKTKEVKFHPLKVRPMFDLEPIETANLNAEELGSQIIEAIEESKPAGKIIRLTLVDVQSPTYNALDFNQIRKLASSAVHFELKVNRKEETETLDITSQEILKLPQEFADFVDKSKLTEKKKEHLLKLGLDYLKKVGN